MDSTQNTACTGHGLATALVKLVNTGVLATTPAVGYLVMDLTRRRRPS
jgi:hypothetical protein